MIMCVMHIIHLRPPVLYFDPAFVPLDIIPKLELAKSEAENHSYR